MLASKLRRAQTFRSEQSLAEVQALLADKVEPVEGELGLVHKISPGGIVLQVLRAPITARPFFGTVSEQQVRFAVVHRSEGLTPYQPLFTGALKTDGQQTVLEGELALHPGVRLWSGLYLFVGVVLILGGATRLGQPGMLGAGLMAMGGVFAIFPQARAWQGFSAACQQTIDAMEQHLGLKGGPD